MASRPFLDFLREHRNGVAHDELSDALNDLVASVAEERRGGTLTVTFAIKPAANVEGGVLVSDKITIKAPPPKKSDSIFFVTPENNLIREDPRQRSLDLREVGAAPAPRDLAAS